MKYTNAPFAVDANALSDLERKRVAFKQETATRNSVQFVLVAAAGVREGSKTGELSQIVVGDDLFVF